MTTERFWEIIEATIAATREEQLELFSQELYQIPLPQLLEFERRFMELHAKAYIWDLWLVAWLCEGGMCSDDGFTDFRCWLISRGRAVYEAALRDADSFVPEVSGSEYPSFEEFGYVTGKVYRSRAGRDFPDLGMRFPKNPTGGDWLRPELKDRSGSHMLNVCVVFNEMGD